MINYLFEGFDLVLKILHLDSKHFHAKTPTKTTAQLPEDEVRSDKIEKTNEVPKDLLALEKRSCDLTDVSKHL